MKKTVTKEMIAGCFPAADDTSKKVMVFVCGPVSCCTHVGPNIDFNY